MGKIENISDQEIAHGKKVLDDHVVDKVKIESGLETLFFCIVSQGTTWEVASNFVDHLRAESKKRGLNGSKYASLEVLNDRPALYAAAKKAKWRFTSGRRFDPSLDYFSQLDHEWWAGIPQAGIEEREKLVKNIKWLGRKTVSFWHLCMGGKNLMTLDVHVMRGLNDLGVELDERYFDPVKRKDGSQIVRHVPSGKDYLRIEAQAKSLLEKDERFSYDGRVDLALATSVLWWRGANRGDSEQGYLFGSGLRSWALPYAKT